MKLLQGAKRFVHQDFFRHSLVFFVGSVLVGGLNYIYYPVLSRLLSVAWFGDVQALFSVLINVSILFTALSVVIVHITSNAKADFADTSILELERTALIITLILGIPWLLAAPLLAGFLRMPSAGPVWLFYGAVILSVLLSTRQAFLQGRQDFWGTSAAAVVAAVAKLVGSVVLVLAGWGVMGAILGLILGQAAAVVYATVRAGRFGLKFTYRLHRRVDWARLLPDLRYGLPVLIVSLSVAFLYSSDVIVVKHFFAPQAAGEYSGIAAIGRIIVFLTGSIGAVMFTMIKLDLPAAANRQLLYRSLGLLAAVGGSATAVLVLWPELVVRLLIGPRYLGAAHLLPWLAAMLLLVAFINLIFYYDLALRRRRAAVIAGLGALAALGLVASFHATILGVILDMVYAIFVMLCMRMGVWILERARGKQLSS